MDDNSDKPCLETQDEQKERAVVYVPEKETCPFCKKELSFMRWCHSCRLKIL